MGTGADSGNDGAETFDLERDPSLTTLRADLSDSYAKSFKLGDGEDQSWVPNQSKLDMLKISADRRSSQLPHGPPSSEDPTLRTLEGGLKDEAKSFKLGEGEDQSWVPNQSKLDMLKTSADRRSSQLPHGPPSS